jgi:2'-5' RNA ligase
MTEEVIPGVTTYPTPTAAWEEWFDDYRFGAMYVFPPEPLSSRVDALRARYDPRSQAICGAHISLTVPVPRPLTPRDGAEFAHAAQAVAPFTVTFGPPRAYAGIPGVVLHIEPADRFTELVQRFEACAAFATAGPRPHPFLPHMTLAEFITLERTAEILAELDPSELSGSFPCEAVSYAVPDDAFRFTERVRWQLGS